MKLCKTCKTIVTESKVKLTIDGRYYVCDHCSDLTHESELNYKTDNGWTPHKRPPCKFKNIPCNSMGKCNRERCTSYIEYTCIKNGVDDILRRERGKSNVINEFKCDVMNRDRYCNPGMR